MRGILEIILQDTPHAVIERVERVTEEPADLLCHLLLLLLLLLLFLWVLY